MHECVDFCHYQQLFIEFVPASKIAKERLGKKNM